MRFLCPLTALCQLTFENKQKNWGFLELMFKLDWSLFFDLGKLFHYFFYLLYAETQECPEDGPLDEPSTVKTFLVTICYYVVVLSLFLLLSLNLLIISFFSFFAVKRLEPTPKYTVHLALKRRTFSSVRKVKG